MRQFQPLPGRTGFPHVQPPQYPSQSATNSSSRQSFPTKQFRSPLPDLMWEQPQTPKRNPRKRMPVPALVGVVLLVAALIVAAFGYVSRQQSINTLVEQATRAASKPASTQAAVLQATSPSTKSAKPASTTLGSDISQFVTRFGLPNKHSVQSAGYYHFRQYANSDLDFLIVQADVSDGGVYAQRVEGLMVQAPGAGWNQQQANAACAAFFPGDSVYEHTVKLPVGYDNVYFSASLAGLFLASTFTDANGNQVKAGMFDVQYVYRSGSIINSCNILLGIQQAQL